MEHPNADQFVYNPKYIDSNVFSWVRARDSGAYQPEFFKRQVSSNRSFVKRLGLQKKLKEHRGCVNTVQWSTDDGGNLLVSGRFGFLLAKSNFFVLYKQQQCNI
jgi:hypothetical protein